MATVALWLTIGFIVCAIAADRRTRRLPSFGAVLAAIWLTVVCSRSPALWMATLGLYQIPETAVYSSAESQGNQIDSLYYAFMLCAAIVILIRRRFSWGAFATANFFLLLLYGYFLCSALWADVGVVVVKRVVKNFGTVLIALLLLTERNPTETIRAVFARVAFVLLPLSVIFIKYFPNIGRVDNRSGDSLFGGVTTHKNTLGMVVFVLTLFVIADLVTSWRERKSFGRKMSTWPHYCVLVAAPWLLVTCESKTSLLCLILGSMIFGASHLLSRLPNPRLVLLAGAGVLLMGVAAEAMFGVSGYIFAMLGRDATLTGRTAIWAACLEAAINPVLGTGYLCFWSTEFARPIIEPFGMLSTAHNGFIETYLDGGYIGVTILAAMLIVAGFRATNQVVTGSLLGKLALVFWILSIVYNNSETAFLRMGPLWLAFVLVTLKCPSVESQYDVRNWPEDAPPEPHPHVRRERVGAYASGMR